EALAQVRENILKAGIVGRLVANDFSGALVSAIVLEEDANGTPVDPIRVAHELEEKVRKRIEGTGVDVQARAGGSADRTGMSGIDVRMIGFAKVVGDIADGALSVIVFAIVTLILTLLAVWLYCQSFRVALIPVLCSVIAVGWQLGMLVVLGYGIDPLGLLAPAIVALLADLVGFITILLIPVQVIREMAVTASVGVAIVILTDLVLLPVLVSFVGFDD